MRGIGRIGVLALVTGIVAIGVAPTALAAGTTIQIANFSFPATTTIAIGDTVRWSNTSGATHTATADDGSFNTGGISNGTSKSVTFSTAGTFAYHCSIHASMTGSIVVTAAGAPSTDTVAPTQDTTTDTTAVVLALLGLTMLVGTLAAERRFRRSKER